MSEIGDSAIDYVKRGLAIIALAPCKKAPSFANGLKDATTSLKDVTAWWDEYPDDNVAIVTGKVSGNIGVIDIDYDDDSGKDGYEYLRAWQRENGELPETWTVTTARGGQHLYYRFEGEVPRNSANEELAIDFRGEGGYVMAPPSVHPNGNTVEWDLDPDDYDLAWADENVLKFIESIAPTHTLSKDGTMFDLPETIKNGERDVVLFKYACSLQSKGMSDADIMVLVHNANEKRCELPFPRNAVDAKIRQALKYPKGEHIDLATVVTDETIMLQYDGKKVARTIDNCMEVLTKDAALKGRFVYDCMAFTKMVILPLPWRGGEGYDQLRDVDYIEAAIFMENRYGIRGRENVTAAVAACCERNRVNPLTEWLNNLKWDGNDHISMMLTNFLGCAPSDYNIAVMHLLMQGAVSRAFNPGTKFDYMPVLVGKQGQGKSFFISRLATRPDWYLDGLATFDGDAAVEKLRGIWFAEIAELAAFKKAKEVEAIKSFVTIRNDTIRPKYGRETEQRPRQCVFVGTTNDIGFLTDKTGNRRYLPIKCYETEPLMDMFEDSAKPYFEQAWAQAVHIHKTMHPKLVLADRIADMAFEKQSEYMEDDPRVGIIQAYLDAVATSERLDKRVCVAELCENALDMRKDEYYGRRSVSNEIHRIMRNEIDGWVPCKGKQKVQNFGSQLCYEPENYELIHDLYVRGAGSQ